MKSAITAASPAARSFGSSASAASTTTLPATKLAGSSPSMYSGWPGDVCSTSLIQIAGCSSGCITAKKPQNCGRGGEGARSVVWEWEVA